MVSSGKSTDMASQVDEAIIAGEMHEQKNASTPELVETPIAVTSTHSTQAIPAAHSVGAPSIRATSNIIERPDLLDHTDGNEDLDEAPPPYTEMEGTSRDAPEVTTVEYSCENSPQLLVAPQAGFLDFSERGAAERSERNMASITPSTTLGSYGPSTPSTALGSPVDESLWPDPLRFHTSSTSSIPRRPTPSQANYTNATSFSSVKAREAGFDLQQPQSVEGAASTSFPDIAILPSTRPINYTREPGRVTAYLIPFPKPRLKGVKTEDIPSRFLIYTPPLPPFSRPAPGEKETQWHRTQRLWQEDVRRATMTNESRVTWNGMKAKGTSLINKGVSKTRSSTVEFLDRVSGGAITSTTQDIDEDEVLSPSATSVIDHTTGSIQELPASLPPAEVSGDLPLASSRASTPTTSGKASVDRPTSLSSARTASKPKTLDSLILVHPPSLTLSPEETRAEFVNSLMRTREQSRNKALVASALLPFAATMDVILLVTFGGLTQTTGVWAYQNTRGAVASKKMTRGLARGGSHVDAEEEAVDLEMRGCTCGHHEGEFGCAESVPKPDKKGKSKKDEDHGIALNIQSSSALDPFTRYLELACLERSFSMFPHIDPSQSTLIADPTEDEILSAIGWVPTRRYGRDLDMEEQGGATQRLSAEQDEEWQRKEARDDIGRIVKKAAAEWITACKGFKKLAAARK